MLAGVTRNFERKRQWISLFFLVRYILKGATAAKNDVFRDFVPPTMYLNTLLSV